MAIKYYYYLYYSPHYNYNKDFTGLVPHPPKRIMAKSKKEARKELEDKYKIVPSDNRFIKFITRRKAQRIMRKKEIK